LLVIKCVTSCVDSKQLLASKESLENNFFRNCSSHSLIEISGGPQPSDNIYTPETINQKSVEEYRISPRQEGNEIHLPQSTNLHLTNGLGGEVTNTWSRDQETVSVCDLADSGMGLGATLIKTNISSPIKLPQVRSIKCTEAEENPGNQILISKSTPAILARLPIEKSEKYISIQQAFTSPHFDCDPTDGIFDITHTAHKEQYMRPERKKSMKHRSNPSEYFHIQIENIVDPGNFEHNSDAPKQLENNISGPVGDLEHSPDRLEALVNSEVARGLVESRSMVEVFSVPEECSVEEVFAKKRGAFIFNSEVKNLDERSDGIPSHKNLEWTNSILPSKPRSSRSQSLKAETNELADTWPETRRNQSQQSPHFFQETISNPNDTLAAHYLSPLDDNRTSTSEHEQPPSTTLVDDHGRDEWIRNSKSLTQSQDNHQSSGTLNYHAPCTHVLGPVVPLLPYSVLSGSGPSANFVNAGNLDSNNVEPHVLSDGGHNFQGILSNLHPHTQPQANNVSHGNSVYQAASKRNPALGGAQCHNTNNNCTFCKAIFVPTVEYPASLCPFCLNHSGIIYCSTACQLADSYHHTAACQHNPSYARVLVQMSTPNATLRVEKFPIRNLSYYDISPECFRQKAFSMFCRTGQFPDLLTLWCRFKGVGTSRSLMGRDSSKHIGDYFIFRSHVTARILSYPPVDVICVGLSLVTTRGVSFFVLIYLLVDYCTGPS
jgi:hypothetical protein